ncbi:hypothetical protein V1L54_20625 [Streptomyces sp. TRM 70361]|uniref:hypothetical protein n=1 Tax=Streptomyces sp. TRM 70361 TaxID=3116553 RepID=UPI002E7BBEC4|nr:hypothetical protein [Streptomyces sp. TRM 70361]MEE1941778.1 hypothetical protein [Streptomyces sp. TRM 70361]
MVLPADSGGLKGELESLKEFKKRVDGILGDLEKSPASPAKVGQQEVSRAAFGGEFAEADGVYREYTRVHTHLTGLSRVLGAQIEAMSIAVHGADVGFGNLEDDLKWRFWQLQHQAQQHRREQDQQQTEKQPTRDGATGTAY